MSTISKRTTYEVVSEDEEEVWAFGRHGRKSVTHTDLTNDNRYKKDGVMWQVNCEVSEELSTA